MSSLFDLTAASIRSTLSAPYRASQATLALQPTASFTQENGSTLHVVVLGANRIGKL